jgi:uncharacterized protein (DUF488 family)
MPPIRGRVHILAVQLHARYEKRNSPLAVGPNSHFFTLGYQKLTPESLLRILRRNRIQILIDVRQNPISRKRGFSKTGLEAALRDAGIHYLHFPSLGTPPSIRGYYCRTGNIELALERYGTYLNSRQDRLKSLMDVVTSRTYCLLCLEADAESCHRSVLAEKLERLTRCKAIHLQ